MCSSYPIFNGWPFVTAAGFTWLGRLPRGDALAIPDSILASMRRLLLALFVVVMPTMARGEITEVETVPVIDSTSYDKSTAEAEILRRVHGGVYDGYEADLCIDDPPQCEDKIFLPYRQIKNGKTTYTLILDKDRWDGLPSPVKKAAVREIIYNTWGASNRTDPPLVAFIKGDPVRSSPLAYLNPVSSDRFLQFASPVFLTGGLGGNSYGPNCWYSAISAIVDSRSAYAKTKRLAPASWNRPRFMGPTEFREHLSDFVQVDSPQFGDIIRYYTDAPVYGGNVYGGEVHAAVYIGVEAHIDTNGKSATREVALTKNGRSDLDVLIFQDVKALDDLYLTSGEEKWPKIKKSYFRVKEGVAVLDPLEAGKLSHAYVGYLVDNKNYEDRWLCLAKLLPPPNIANADCMTYPQQWLPLLSAGQAQMPEAPLARTIAPLFNPIAPFKSMKSLVLKSGG